MSVQEPRAFHSMMLLVDRTCKRKSGTPDGVVAAPAANAPPRQLSKLDDAIHRSDLLTAKARPMMEQVRGRLQEVRASLDRLRWVSRLRPVARVEATPAIVVSPHMQASLRQDSAATTVPAAQAPSHDVLQLQQQVRELQRQLQDVQADAKRIQTAQNTQAQATAAQFSKLGSNLTATCALVQEFEPRVTQADRSAAMVAKRLSVLESTLLVKDEFDASQRKESKELFDGQLRQVHEQLQQLQQAQGNQVVKTEEAVTASVRAVSVANSLEADVRDGTKRQAAGLEELTARIVSIAHCMGAIELHAKLLTEDMQRLEGNLTEQQLTQADLAAKLTTVSGVVTDLQARELMPTMPVEQEAATTTTVMAPMAAPIATELPPLAAPAAAAAAAPAPMAIDWEATWQSRYDEKQSTIERAVSVKVPWMPIDLLPYALLTLTQLQPRAFLIEIVATKGPLVVRSKRRVNAQGNVTESLVQGDDSLIHANHASRLDESLVMPSSSSGTGTGTGSTTVHSSATAAAAAAGYSETDLHALAALAEQSSTQRIGLRTYFAGVDDRRVAFDSDDPAALVESGRISLPVSGIELRATISDSGQVELSLRRNIRRLPTAAIREGSWSWVVSVKRQSVE